ncbi:MAG: substrate-binding domain-containing protein [Chloroflexi bacterium]|nr:substrate-binding domain-containing protein [Chloroflexota bacterium]MCL5076186.1 substrate-binding domain-containing protein [Chloroflexota bacterium]
MRRFVVLSSVLIITLSLLVGCSLASSLPSAAPGTTPGAPSTSAAPVNKEVILATTTSTMDSGLLDVLVPDFEKRTGYVLKPLSLGTGQALAVAARGEADVVLVHAPVLEKKFMADGHGINRRLVMHNDFVIVGPPADPAKIKGSKMAIEAFQKIAEHKNIFISRGDNSGTDTLEKSLWKKAGIQPSGQWYQEAGQGMGATLNIASEKDGYTLTDRATLLALKRTLRLEILVEKEPALLNIYHVIEVDPQKHPQVNHVGGKSFADYMVSKEAQEIVRNFGVDKYGQPLFFPDAGKKEPVS